MVSAAGYIIAAIYSGILQIRVVTFVKGLVAEFVIQPDNTSIHARIIVK